jgi:tetratricopeptide (TPR) repeat protein
VIVTDISERELKRPRGTEPLKGIIDKLNREEKVPNNIIVSMQNLNSLSTFGAHPKDFDPRQVKPVLLDLTTVLEWYMKYLQDQESVVNEAGASQGKRKEPGGLIRSRSKSRKRTIMGIGVLLVAAIIIVSLIVFNIIGVGKQARAGSIGSIIILPFENYTGQDTLEWLVSGMHSSLIQDMGKIGSLHIPGSTTSQVFKDSHKTIKEITSEVKVDAALEIAVLCLGEDSVCFQTRLIKPGKEEEQLWLADYKIPRNQILNWSNGITKQIAREINIKLTPEEERLLSKSRLVNREAYDDFLKAQLYWDDFSEESLYKSLEYLNSAIEKESDWAPLYAGIANVWIGIQQMGFEPPSVASPKIYENLNKAIELDPDIPDSHYLSGLIAHVMEWDWEKSEREYKKALTINPSDAVSRIFYAQLLMVLQRNDEALTQGQWAMSLDPLNPLIKIWYGAVLMGVGDCKTSLTLAEEVVATDPENYLANAIIEGAGFLCKDYDKAIKAARYCIPIHIDEDTYKEIERIYSEDGIVSAYEEIMKQIEAFATNNPVNPTETAMRYIWANQPDKAMDWLEKGFEIHDPQMTYITTHAYSLHPLFNNPRFIAICEKMNLPLPKSD